MFFCTLKPLSPKTGKAWDAEGIKYVAFEWRELLKTMGIEAQAYDIGDEAGKARGDPVRILVTTQTGWKGYEMRDFLLRQPELAEVEWDQVKYTPEDLEKIEKTKGKAGGAPFRIEDLMQGGGAPGAGKKARKGKGKGKGKGKKPAAAAKEEL
jgi:hypothetical protein